MKKLLKSAFVMVTTVLFVPLSLNANEEIRSSLKANGIPVYFDKPGISDSFSGMFSEGKVYGRLRNNNFYYRWGTEDSSHTDHMINGFGASIVYKSASYADFDFGVGLYAS
ncbi:MAG: hypothetical protein KAT10_00990, partial [Sulfurimonas sp.]|nr:hypothetical protein [Sulfurimonas sp.]